MAKLVLADGYIVANGFEVGALCRNVMIDGNSDLKESTNYGSEGWKEFSSGLRDQTMTFETYLDDTVDHDLEAYAFGSGVAPVIFTPLTRTPAEGGLAYMGNVFSATNSRGGQVGELHMCNFTLKNGPIGRGIILDFQTAFAASADSTGVQHGAVAAGLRVRAVIAATAIAGSPELDVIIESDDNSGFTTATTRLTFGQITTANVSEYLETSGAAITDDYWRVSATFGGTGSINFIVSLAII